MKKTTYNNIIKNLIDYVKNEDIDIPIEKLINFGDDENKLLLKNNLDLFKNEIIKRYHCPYSKVVVLPKHGKQEKVVTVVFDIRYSSDILRNVKHKQFFLFIEELSEKVKQVLFSESYNGIYDKFTGDGFIVHFNKDISGNDFLERALVYTQEIIRKSKNIFEKIFTNLEIDCSDEIGISAGIDCGQILWFQKGIELTAIGKSIVYASRLCNCASKNEIYVNNSVYQSAKKNFSFSDKSIKPKGFQHKIKVHKIT